MGLKQRRRVFCSVITTVGGAGCFSKVTSCVVLGFHYICYAVPFSELYIKWRHKYNFFYGIRSSSRIMNLPTTESHTADHSFLLQDCNVYGNIWVHQRQLGIILEICHILPAFFSLFFVSLFILFMNSRILILKTHERKLLWINSVITLTWREKVGIVASLWTNFSNLPSFWESCHNMLCSVDTGYDGTDAVPYRYLVKSRTHTGNDEKLEVKGI